MASARQKALVFSILLILTSTAFVAAAAHGTAGALAPFRDAEFPFERPLSRHLVPLAVHVGAEDAEGPERVAGAEVRLVRLARNNGDVPLASQATDEQGRAMFHVPRGLYRVEVTHEGLQGQKVYDLRHGLRVAVLFDAAGVAHFRDADHRELERRGDTATLLVRVASRDNQELRPMAGVQVQVYRVEGETETLLHDVQTNERGAALLHLHRGPYRVAVAWDGDTASQRVPLRQDARVGFVHDGDDFEQPPHGRRG